MCFGLTESAEGWRTHGGQSEAKAYEAFHIVLETGKIFIWIRCNPLKKSGGKTNQLRRLKLRADYDHAAMWLAQRKECSSSNTTTINVHVPTCQPMFSSPDGFLF
jgi:hypothetical protein